MTATFRGFQVAVPVTVSTGNTIPPLASNLEITPTAVTLPAGTLSVPLVVNVTFDNGVEREVTASQGVVFSSNNPNVTVNANQQIAVGNNVASGATAVITATYLGQSAQVQVSVVAATLQSISIAPANASLPFGGFEQSLAVTGQFSNGSSVQLNPASLTFSEDSSLFSVDSTGKVVTASGGVPGTAAVTVTTNAPLPSFQAVANITVGQIYIQSLVVSPGSPVNLAPGGFVDFTVVASLSNGTSVNVSEFDALVITLNDSDDSAVLNGNRLVAVNAGGADPTVSFSFPGAGQGGNNVQTNISINIEDVKLASAQYLFAGNPVDVNEDTVNLPRGYVGVFEVIGTFTNGSVRKLEPSEYSIDPVTVASPGGSTGAVVLFNNSYTLPAVNTSYTNGGFDDLALPVRNRVTLGGGVTGSTGLAFATSNDFRAVVADWRRGEVGENGYVENVTITGSPASGNVGNFSRFIINIADSLEPTAGQFSKTVDVTVTDPDGFVTIATNTAIFANYPEDPNIPAGVPREFEVRVNFSGRTAAEGGLNNGVDPPTRPPSVNEQNGFKLAEANLVFEQDVEPGNPFLLTHRPTQTGFIALFAANPVAVSAIEIFVQPLGGLNGRTQIPPSELNRAVAQDTFGPAFSFTFELSDGVAGTEVINRVTRVLERVDNNGTGFDIVNPRLFTLDPIGPLNLTIGTGQLFRTAVQFGATGSVVDRSRDYRPVITNDPDTTLVGIGDLASGRLTVNAVNTSATNAIIRVVDVTGAFVNPVLEPGAPSTYTDSRGVTGTPTTSVTVDTTALP